MLKLHLKSRRFRVQLSPHSVNERFGHFLNGLTLAGCDYGRRSALHSGGHGGRHFTAINLDRTVSVRTLAFGLTLVK